MNRVPLRLRSSLLVLCGLLLLLVRPSLAAENASTTIPLWGRFEVAVANTCNYGNPFVDVTLHATFPHPDRSRASFWGYYDGEGHGGQTSGVWRLRFLPDQLGTWSYEASFSDGSPGAREGVG